MKDFIKNRLGIGWLTILFITGLLLISDPGFKFFVAYFLIGAFCIIIINYAKPDVIITSTGSIFWAKVFWNFGAQTIVLLFLFNSFCGNPGGIDRLKEKVKSSCTTEQIAKTGIVGCKEAKDNLSSYIKKELPKMKEEYKVAQSNIKQFSKDKDSKCSEKGLKNHGSEGCSAATRGFDKNTKSAEELNKQIENYQKELEELKK